MTEAIGYELIKKDESKDLDKVIEGVNQETCLEFAIQLADDPYSCETELIEHIRQSDIMLAAPFNYYNFSVRLNIDE